MNLLTFVGAFLALVAHVLVAVSIATNFWLVFADQENINNNTNTNTNVKVVDPLLPALNPRLNDTGLSDRIVRYRGARFGIWVSCYTELDFGEELSCGFIDHTCHTNICWVKENVGDKSLNEKSCKSHPVSALTVNGKCTSFQAVRGLAVVGTFFSILGTTLLFVSLCCDMSRLLSAVGSISTFVSAISLLVAFAVFLASIVNAQSIPADVANTGWSFALLIASWVIGIVAASTACVGAFAGSDKDDDSGYSSD